MNRLEQWLSAWVDIICGIVGVLSFTLYRPGWDLYIRAYFTKKRLRKKINDKN